MVVKLPKPYSLAAEGSDEYRNFVIRPGLKAARFVRAVEFHPNSRAVHHAFIKVDVTRESYDRDGRDGRPGFPGIHGPDSAQMPEGQFLTWQPGKMAAASPDGCWWTLETNADLVVQLHLQPSGKVDNVEPELALYFTDTPPRYVPFKLHLVSYKMIIPPGDASYSVEESITVPCDLEVLRVLPHAHFLATKLEATAHLPGGQVRPLITIPRWEL